MPVSCEAKRVPNQVICQACSCVGDLRSLSWSPALSSCLQNNPRSQPRPVSQLRQLRSKGTFEGVWTNPTKVRSCSVRPGCSVPCWEKLWLFPGQRLHCQHLMAPFNSLSPLLSRIVGYFLNWLNCPYCRLSTASRFGGFGFFSLHSSERSLVQCVKISILTFLCRLRLKCPQYFVNTQEWREWVSWSVSLLTGQRGGNAPRALFGSIILHELVLSPDSLILAMWAFQRWDNVVLWSSAANLC